MPKYFSIPKIKEAIERLARVDSKWIIPPFVFATNLVDVNAYKELNAFGSPDPFLDNFFSGDLIGLRMREGANTIRPKFKELQSKGEAILDAAGAPIAGANYIVHQKVKLWGSAYSRNGYNDMQKAGQIEKEPGSRSSYRLTAAFQPAFEAALPSSFKFEDLLVWLFAFREIPDDVISWQLLWERFKATFTNSAEFPEPYRGRFALSSPPAAWPTDFMASKPTDLQYQESLLPSSFVEGLDLEFWKKVCASLEGLIKGEYEGYSDEDMSRLARMVTSGLSGTKRVFLLGDPGTGKSTLARLIREGMRESLDEARFFTLESEVTEKTTESTLVGFTGLDGGWIAGALTTEISGRSLFNKSERLSERAVRNQVNLVLLDEANRKDIEALLAKLQTSLDSLVQEPRDEAHGIVVGRDGVKWLSPHTYFVMTGNSPKDDEGRVEQSRPFKRRPSLVRISNPLSKRLPAMDDAAFTATARAVWRRCYGESQGQHLRDVVDTALGDEVQGMQALRAALVCMNSFGLGVSYGLLRKLLILMANELALGAPTFRDAIDAALCGGVSALTGVRTTNSGKSLRAAFLELNEIQAALPGFHEFVTEALADTSEYGTVVPHF